MQTAFAILARTPSRYGRARAASTLHRIRATLRVALNAAVRRGLIEANPAHYLELPPTARPRAVVWIPARVAHWRATGEHPTVAVWTARQTAQFLHHIRQHRLHPLFRLITLVGLRRGEACALRWCDVDFHHRALVVCRQLQQHNGARGSSPPLPRCVLCGRSGRPLTATEGGGMCSRCAARRNPLACLRCGVVKPVAAHTDDGQPICERCRRAERGRRECGRCGKIASIAVRARDGAPDVCVNCYRMPEAVCSVCGRRRECNFATSHTPICLTCSPRATATCARCGHDRPPAVRWDEGPLCDPCYTAALRHRGACRTCGRQRRLVAPPGPQATLCADCAGLPATHTCTDCGLEDKL